MAQLGTARTFLAAHRSSNADGSVLGVIERRSEQDGGILSQRAASEASQRTQPVLPHRMVARVRCQQDPGERTQRTLTLKSTNFSPNLVL